MLNCKAWGEIPLKTEYFPEKAIIFKLCGTPGCPTALHLCEPEPRDGFAMTNSFAFKIREKSYWIDHSSINYFPCLFCILQALKMWYPFLVLLVLSPTINLSNQDVIDNILLSLSKGITYFDMQGRNINLDGVVGYLILQGKPLFYRLNVLKKYIYFI